MVEATANKQPVCEVHSISEERSLSDAEKGICYTRRIRRAIERRRPKGLEAQKEQTSPFLVTFVFMKL